MFVLNSPTIGVDQDEEEKSKLKNKKGVTYKKGSRLACGSLVLWNTIETLTHHCLLLTLYTVKHLLTVRHIVWFPGALWRARHSPPYCLGDLS